jgi:hypothetical protein
MSRHVTSRHVTSHNIISYHIIYHIMSCHVISYHTMSCHIISYHIIYHHIISNHITSHHIISYHTISSGYFVSFHYNHRFLWFLLMVEPAAITSVRSINWVIIKIEIRCVYWAVRKESLNIIQFNFRVYSVKPRSSEASHEITVHLQHRLLQKTAALTPRMSSVNVGYILRTKTHLISKP